MAKAMQPQKMRFSQAIQTPMYKNLVNNTLGDPARGARFIANITSAVAVNPALQECNPGTILAGALLGESLLLQPSPQLGQFYLVPFKSKAKRDRQGNVIEPASVKAQFMLGYLLYWPRGNGHSSWRFDSVEQPTATYFSGGQRIHNLQRKLEKAGNSSN